MSVIKQFNDQSMKRIGRAVRQSERSEQGRQSRSHNLRQQLICARITGNAGGGGKYVGKTIAQDTSGFSPSTDLSITDFGTLAAAENCYLKNPGEEGESTHVLTEDSMTPLAWGYIDGAYDGKITIVIVSISYNEDCTEEA